MQKVNFCNSHRIDFPKADTFVGWLFSPQMVVGRSTQAAARVQRWLIDNDDFYTSVKKSLTEYTPSGRVPPTFEIEKAVGYLNETLWSVSLAGRCLRFIIMSMAFRAMELFCKSLNTSLYNSVPLSKIKIIINILATIGIIGFALSYGNIAYDFIIPVVFEKIISFILSYSWSNYLKQSRTLSGTKDFEFKDFCIRNFQAAVIRVIPFIVLLMRDLPKTINQDSLFMTVCEDSRGKFLITELNQNYHLEEYFLDLIASILGKIIVDLSYIFGLGVFCRVFSKDLDLRDPSDWMFSVFGGKVSSSIENQEEQGEVYYQNSRKRAHTYRQETSAVEDGVIDEETPSAESCVGAGGVRWISPGRDKGDRGDKGVKGKPTDKGLRDRGPGGKLTDKGSGDKGKEPMDEAKKKGDSASRKSIEHIRIKVGNSVLSFQRLYYGDLKKDIWGVIINDSVEKQTLVRYGSGLANRYIGGGTISPLKGYGGRLFEIRPGIDSRLIGKLHDGDHYLTLQNYMPMEEAVQFIRELEKYEINEKVSLIVFSKEAKKHNDINRVAKSL